MTVKQAVELIKEKHPGKHTGVIVELINQKMLELCEDSDLLKEWVKLQANGTDFTYDFPENFSEVLSVDINGEPATKIARPFGRS